VCGTWRDRCILTNLNHQLSIVAIVECGKLNTANCAVVQHSVNRIVQKVIGLAAVEIKSLPSAVIAE